MSGVHAHASHSGVLPDLGRIAGDVRAIAREIEEEAYCVDILTRLRVVRAALKDVEDRVLGEHVEQCVAAATESADPDERERKIREILTVIGDRPVQTAG